MIRRTVPALLVSAALLLLPLVAFSADPTAKKEEKTLQGEILDLGCFLSHNGKGPDHAMCAQMCVKGGQPMGLLTADGSVYILTADHEDSKPFNQAKELAGQKAEIRGSVGSNAGLKGLTVLAVKAL
jgi:hypothetical protein